MTDGNVIEVEPVAYSSEKSGHERTRHEKQSPTSGYYTYKTGDWKKQAEPVYATNAAYHASPETTAASTSAKPKSKAGAVARIVAGGAIALVGIPMLVLPGPGIVAIGGGAAMMASGAKTLIGK